MNFATTLTGNFPIGFRLLKSEWQADLDALAAWAVENRFGFVDVTRKGAAAWTARRSRAELRAGSTDLLRYEDYRGLIAPGSAQRQATIDATVAHIEACAQTGTSIFFAVTIPADKDVSRKQNFAYLVESFSALLPALETTNSRVAIEGWPGPGAVCCTPETYRAFFEAVASDRFGVNFDPSHLLRMGIDAMRFLEEFADRVFHVHAKDTALSREALYECGHEQPSTFAEPHRWGGSFWRYTLPGHGETDWAATFGMLKDAGYAGLVSVELEDENYNGTEAGEQRGLIESRDFLTGC